jgi:hypothetical protein
MRVYLAFSELLLGEADVGFASAVVQALNLILITSPTVRMRRMRRRGGGGGGGGYIRTAKRCMARSRV